MNTLNTLFEHSVNTVRPSPSWVDIPVRSRIAWAIGEVGDSVKDCGLLFANVATVSGMALLLLRSDDCIEMALSCTTCTLRWRTGRR